MTSKAEAPPASQQQEAQTELDKETADIMPDRTLTAEEAKQDYQKQLELLAEQEAEYNARKRDGSPGQERPCQL
jgi:hypothetical protein